MKNEAKLNSIKFIDSYTKDSIRSACYGVATTQFFEELESLCKNFLNQKIQELETARKEMAERSFTAENLISRMKHFFKYSKIKGDKMRMNRKEFDSAMERISTQEQEKVNKWVEDNGGLDKYIV